MGCGVDATTYLDEIAPSGTITFQGQFLTPATVSGTAQIYESSGQIVVRLRGLVTPVETRYFMYLEKSGSATAVYVSLLKAPQGNQNYYTGIAVGADTYTRVVFRGNANPASAEISAAVLAAVP